MAIKKEKSSKTEASVKAKSAWENISPEQEKILEKRSANYIHFLSECKTERETIDYVEKRAQKLGFTPMPNFGQGKQLKPGSKVYFINKNKAMGLAIIGKKHSDEGFRLIASHHDVPRLDIKPTPVYEKHGLSLFKTHYYGGVKKFQWAAIPLALHGCAMTKDGEKINFKIGHKPTDPVFTITDLAPHVNAKVQRGRTSPNVLEGEELNLLVGNRPQKTEKKDDKTEADRVKKLVLEHFKKETGLEEDDIAWSQIQVVPAMEPRDVGLDRSMIGGYGHDDRACVGASFEALQEIKVPEYTCAVLFLDKEEIGSCGPNGAQSLMVSDFLGMLTEATSGLTSFAAVRRAIAATLVISADTSAPIDPTFEAAHDPLNAALLGHGVWISKYAGSGGKSRSSEVEVEFINYIRRMLLKNNIPYQFGELGKVDEGGGGTVAYLLANLNMDVIDLSLATLSLHSPFEIISKVDYHYTVEAYKAFMEKAY